MCTLTNVSSKKSFTGYKMAVERRGRFYSVFSGVEYAVGLVPRTRVAKKNSIIGSSFKAIKRWRFYEPGMVGKTGVMRDVSMARLELRDLQIHLSNERKDWSLVLLKMKISGGLWEGKYTGNREHDIVVGDHVDSLRKISPKISSK